MIGISFYPADYWTEAWGILGFGGCEAGWIFYIFDIKFDKEMNDKISEYQADFDEFQENLFKLYISERAENFDPLNETKILFLGAYENYKNEKFKLAQRLVLIALRLNPTDIDLQLYYLQLLLKTEDKIYAIEIEANQRKFDETYTIISNNIESGAIVLNDYPHVVW